jgi:transcriptional regulator with XRE-family HTH domain
MIGQIATEPSELVQKIGRLIEECGLPQEEFARACRLSRQTVNKILQGRGCRRPRNSTVFACARFFGMSVAELRCLSLEELLGRVRSGPTSEKQERRRLYEQATQPALAGWLACHPDRARRLASQEMDELLSLQGTGGPLTSEGVEYFVNVIERKRELIHKVHAIAGTDHLDLLEKLIEAIYEQIRPYRSCPPASQREISRPQD